MGSLQFCFVIFLFYQFSDARSIQSGKVVDYDRIELTPEEAEQLASWTEDSKQNIWELSGQFEGDMVLSTGQRNGLIDETLRWPNREIPYEIDAAFDDAQKQWIKQSLNEFLLKTCITPRERRDGDEDYVYITGEPTGCHSNVGRRGGRQTLNLQRNVPGRGCFRSGTIVHEFVHALGFYHAQSSSNRDDFLDIYWENIKEGKENNFKKYTIDYITDFGQEYDYESVMHYSAFAFSKNGLKTIVTKDPQAQIGQREGMSDTDALKLNMMYKCDNTGI